MVYGAAFCAVSYKPTLAKAAYADSKALTEEKRDALFLQLKADAAMGWIVDSISAEALSTKMLRRCAHAGQTAEQLSTCRQKLTFAAATRSERYNLNAISYDSARGMIQVRARAAPAPERGSRATRQAALDAGVNVAEVVVDTVGDADQYTQRCACVVPASLALADRQRRRRLKDWFPGMKALAAAKADRDYPIVSAASICAKVTRDTELRDWKFEPGLTGDAAPSRKFGCGYPGGACCF